MQQNTNDAKVVIDRKTRKNNDFKPTLEIAVNELKNFWNSNVPVILSVSKDAPASDGYSLKYRNGKIEISSASTVGVLYGSYTLLRMQQLDKLGQLMKKGVSIEDFPTFSLRMLNHWDNPDGTVERGYAGKSLFWPQFDKQRIIEYARANASIGINAVVLNNVNAKTAMLETSMLRQTKEIADILRPYGIRVCLSVNFASPKAVGGLATADPLDAKVRRWWKDKVDEIYSMIPDFCGFLVKANSEGEPGPMDYGRTHADGANMLAEALKPHDGIVVWRAFVYSATGDDRASQAYDEFMPFDGMFEDNVTIQIKNGPIDFQPREPVSPLLLSMKKTDVMPELQITQEYLGESIHAVFLAPMWREMFDVLQKYKKDKMDAIAGVANIGNSINWCGSDMAQANWFAFGRLAWNPDLSSQQIADDFLRLTFTSDNRFVEPVKNMMLKEREAAVDYMMPMGLHHLFAAGHHYGPEPWCQPEGWREDWMPKYYHKADKRGLGFDRTAETGSGNVNQYPDPLKNIYGNIASCPEILLLWFHHVDWHFKMSNGDIMWNNLCHAYDAGVRNAEDFVKIWNDVKPYIDEQRWTFQMKRYQRQAKDAWWWRDACLLYFQTFSQKPFPDDVPPCRHNLQELMDFHLDMDNYSVADMDLLP